MVHEMGEILLDKANFEKIVQYVTITWIEQWCFLYQYGWERIWDRLRGNTVSIEIIDKLADVVGKLQLDKQSEIDIPKQISEIKAFL